MVTDPVLVQQVYLSELARGKYGALTRTARRYARSTTWTRQQLARYQQEAAQREQARVLCRDRVQTAECKAAQPERAEPVTVQVYARSGDIIATMHFAYAVCALVTACVTVAACAAPFLLLAMVPVLGMWSETARYARVYRSSH